MKQKNKRLPLVLILLLMSMMTYAQSFTLKGKVLDDEGNPVEWATVSCVKQGKVTMTNLKGEYSMTLQSADSVEIKYSMVGYRSRTRVLRRPQGKQTLLITMQPQASLDEVTVTEKRRQTTGTEQLDIKNMQHTPSASGNAVEELIQQQAGVSTHNELSSQYNVRGGSFDENSVYINNVEVYRPLLIRSGQQEGLSIINGDMVEKVAFSSGGFEAKYGDKMSSTLDITYKRPKQFEANVTASLLGATGYLGYGNKKFSMSHGIRYKTNRYLLGSLQTKGEYKPNFVDYQTFLSWKPSKRWTLEFLGNISENHYNFTPKDRETSFGTLENVKSFKVYFDGQEKDLFRTLFGTFSVAHHFSDSTTVKLLVSAFHTKEREAYDIQGQYWLDDTQTSENLGVGTYMEHARNYLKANVTSIKLMLNQTWKKHALEAGFTYKREKVTENSREYEMRDSSGYSIPHTPDRLDLIYSLSSDHEISSDRIEAYAMDTFHFMTGGSDEEEEADNRSFWTVNAGVRMGYWSFTKELIFSPRASVALVPKFNHNMTFRLAAGLYYQAPFYKELRDTTSFNGTTIVTLNNKLKSQQSIHIVGAFDYRFKVAERPFKFTAEAYFKILRNLNPYNVNNMKITYYGENLCSGYATGIDLKLFGEFVPGTDSWLTFSWMKTNQKFGDVSVPLPTDQRYAVNLHFSDYFPGSKRWLMTLKFAFADGLPFGAPHKGIERQNFRAPAYKRADIGMSYLLVGDPEHPNSKKRFWAGVKRVWIGVDCLNLFGINNVNSYYWVTDVMNHQFAVPNYLTGRQINGKIRVEF